MSRQTYYKTKTERRHKQINESLIVDLVRAERNVQPRIGAKKLYYMLSPKLKNLGINSQFTPPIPSAVWINKPNPQIDNNKPNLELN